MIKVLALSENFSVALYRLIFSMLLTLGLADLDVLPDLFFESVDTLCLVEVSV